MSNAASGDAPPGSYVANHAAGTLVLWLLEATRASWLLRLRDVCTGSQAVTRAGGLQRTTPRKLAGMHGSPPNGRQNHGDAYRYGATKEGAALRHGEIFGPLFS